MTRLVSYPPSGGPSYSPTDRSWRFASSGSAPAWTPASLSSIIDYGDIADLSLLKQDSAGTTAVTSAGDPVGYWSGYLGALVMLQANAASKPTYQTDGVDFKPGGTIRSMSALLAASRAQTLPCFIGYRLNGVELNSSDQGISFGFASQAAFNWIFTGLLSLGFGQAFKVRNTSNDPYTVELLGDHTFFMNFDGAGAKGYRDNGEESTLTVGTNTTTLTRVNMEKSSSYDRKTRVGKWVVCSDDLTADERALVQTWMES